MSQLEGPGLLPFHCQMGETIFPISQMGETGHQEGAGACPGPHGKLEAELGLEPCVVSHIAVFLFRSRLRRRAWRWLGEGE